MQEELLEFATRAAPVGTIECLPNRHERGLLFSRERRG